MSACRVTFYPQNKKVTVKKSTSLLDAVSKAHITINNLCGGDGICGRCKMVIKEGEVSAEVSPKLTREEIKSSVVLACMTRVEGDLVIQIPEDYETIQEGINAAENGDTVLVADGIYYENLGYFTR